MQMTTQTTMGSVTQNITFGIDAVQDSRSYSATLNQPLFVGALLPGYKIAQLSADLTKEDLRRSVLDISYNVTTAYFSVLKAAKMVKLAEESKQMADSHYNQVNSMVKAGVATRADLLRASVQQANSEVGLTRAKNGLELAKDAFNNALGKGLEEPVDLDEVGSVGAVAKLPEYRSVLDKSYDNRPEWKQYQIAKEIGEQNLRVNQLAYLPTVMLNGTIGNRVTEYPSFTTDVDSWSVMGIASWTIFDGLGIQNRIREASASLDAQKATEEQLRNGIALEVRDAYLSLRSAMETIGSAKKAVDSAEENYKVSTQRYRSGVGTNIEELDAQVLLTQARINYLQTVFDVEVAKAKINKIVGIGVI
jgi:outer membrane protein